MHLGTSIIAFVAFDTLSAKTRMDLTFSFWQDYGGLMCLLGLTNNTLEEHDVISCGSKRHDRRQRQRYLLKYC